MFRLYLNLQQYQIIEKSFIENNIAFITERQVFLPFIGTLLTDEKEHRKPAENLFILRNSYFLLYLYGKKNDCIFQKPENSSIYSNDTHQSGKTVGSYRFIHCNKRWSQ